MPRQYYYAQKLHTGWLPNRWDILALLLFFTLLVLLVKAATGMATPYHLGEPLSISLDPSALPDYALRTVLRMGAAIMLSLLFSLIIGTLAATSRQAEKILIPIIDIMQSVPILGFLSITIIGFIRLFPNSMLGPECAAIFALFTSQVWNMTLSIYQSLKTIPLELQEATRVFQLSRWQRYWRLEIPFALPALLWNTMMSMSAGWFFIVAAEAISVSNQSIFLPGIGSYIGTAIDKADLTAIGYAVFTMFVVILIYDQLLFRPLIRWSEKFAMAENNVTEMHHTRPWLLAILHRTAWLRLFIPLRARFIDEFINFPWLRNQSHPRPMEVIITPLAKKMILLWDACLVLLVAACCITLVVFIKRYVTLPEVLHVFYLGAITALRVFLLIVAASIVWVPVGVWLGLKPRAAAIAQPIAQFLAAFPANLLFPFFVYMIITYDLSVNIWTTPLMILGTQWYILFNVIAGAKSIPRELLFAAQNFGVSRGLWWRRLALPAVFPYFVTGALTAAGGAWNASIVAEYVSWGNTNLIATGLGAYIRQYTVTGDFARIALGIGVMCVYVVIFNRLIWRRLYDYAEQKYKLS